MSDEPESKKRRVDDLQEVLDVISKKWPYYKNKIKTTLNDLFYDGPQIRMPRNSYPELICDVFGFLKRCEIDQCEILNRYLRNLIHHFTDILPLHHFSTLKIASSYFDDDRRSSISDTSDYSYGNSSFKVQLIPSKPEDFGGKEVFNLLVYNDKSDAKWAIEETYNKMIACSVIGSFENLVDDEELLKALEKLHELYGFKLSVIRLPEIDLKILHTILEKYMNPSIIYTTQQEMIKNTTLSMFEDYKSLQEITLSVTGFKPTQANVAKLFEILESEIYSVEKFTIELDLDADMGNLMDIHSLFILQEWIKVYTNHPDPTKLIRKLVITQIAIDMDIFMGGERFDYKSYIEVLKKYPMTIEREGKKRRTSKEFYTYHVFTVKRTNAYELQVKFKTDDIYSQGEGSIDELNTEDVLETQFIVKML